MKKFFTLMAVGAVALAANAQIVSSSSRKVTTEEAEFANYNRVFVSYAPMTLSYKGGGDETAGGFAVGWLGGWSVSKTMPLYVEGGLNLKYNHYSETISEYNYDCEYSMTFLSLNVPVNISYKWSVPNVDGLSIAPYAGLHLTGNIIGKEKESSEDGEEDWSFFDKDDMGDDTAKRIQVGYQVGVGVNYKALYLGVGYSAEFTEYMKNMKTGGLTLSLGYTF